MPEDSEIWAEWLNNTRFSYSSEEEKQQTLKDLYEIKDKVLDRAKLKPDDILIDIGTGTGLLAFGAFERLLNSGKVIASDAYQGCLDECVKIAKEIGIENKITFLHSDASDIKMPDNSVDVVVVRSVLVHIPDKTPPINEFFRILKPGGRVSIYEPIMSKNTKFYEFLDPDNFKDYEKFKEIENKIALDKNNALMNFDETSLVKNFEEAGFINVNFEEHIEHTNLYSEEVEAWFNAAFSPGKLTLKERFLQYVTEQELINYINSLKTVLFKKSAKITMPRIFLSAEKI